MTRFAAILLALKLAAPHWGSKVATAHLLERLERRYHVQAELVIADAEYESRWREAAVNPSSGTAGLLQIQPLNFQGCGLTGNRWSEECWVARRQLYDWWFNLETGARYFAFARDRCRSKGRGSRAAQWLWVPTGWDAVSHAQCGYRNGKRLPTPKGIASILQRAASLRHVGR